MMFLVLLFHFLVKLIALYILVENMIEGTLELHKRHDHTFHKNTGWNPSRPFCCNCMHYTTDSPSQVDCSQRDCSQSHK